MTITEHKRRFKAYDDQGVAYPLDVYVNVATAGAGYPRAEFKDIRAIMFPGDEPYVEPLGEGRYWVKALDKVLTSDDLGEP